MPEKKNRNTEKVSDRTRMHYRFRLNKKYDAALIDCIESEARKNHLTTQGYIKYSVIASMPEAYFREYYSSSREASMPVILKKLQKESERFLRDEDLPEIRKPEENTVFSYQTQIDESVSDTGSEIDTEDLLDHLETLNHLCSVANCSFESMRNILKLYQSFGTEQIFEKKDIMKICTIGSDASNKLITKMKKMDIVEPIRVPNGRVYKFRKSFQVKL